MNAPAAISGEFTTIKHVPSRKVYQLVIEIAEEAAQHAFDALGMPGNGGHIALARLVEEHAMPDRTDGSSQTGAQRRPFTELPYAQQSAIRCSDAAFHRYCAEKAPVVWRNLIGRETAPSDAAASLVRDWCRVTSRADIQKGTQAGDNWEVIEGEFYAWQRGRR